MSLAAYERRLDETAFAARDQAATADLCAAELDAHADAGEAFADLAAEAAAACRAAGTGARRWLHEHGYDDGAGLTASAALGRVPFDRPGDRTLVVGALAVLMGCREEQAVRDVLLAFRCCAAARLAQLVEARNAAALAAARRGPLAVAPVPAPLAQAA